MRLNWKRRRRCTPTIERRDAEGVDAARRADDVEAATDAAC